MPRTISYQADIAGVRDTPRGVEIDAQEVITVVDRVATVVGGTVHAHGESEIHVRNNAVVHAFGHTRVTVGARTTAVIYATEHVEVEAHSGHIYANDYARVFLLGRASAEVNDRVLVVADGKSETTIAGGAPTVRRLSPTARVSVSSGVDAQQRRIIR